MGHNNKETYREENAGHLMKIKKDTFVYQLLEQLEKAPIFSTFFLPTQKPAT